MPRYALDITAQVAKFQAELAKIPGMTDAQAARAALALETRLNKAQEQAARAAQRAAGQARQAWQAANVAAAQPPAGAGASLGSLERGASKAKESVASLASAVAILDPRLGAIAVTGGNAIGAIKGLAGASTLSAAAMGPLLPVGLGLGAMYLALRSRTREAEEAQRAASEEAQRAQGIFSRLGDVMRSLEDDVRLATGQVDELGLQLERRAGKINQVYDQSERFVRQRLATLQQEQANLRSGNRRVTEALVQDQERNQAALAAAQEQLDALVRKRGEALGAAELLVDQERSERRARDESTEATRRQAAAERAAAEARAEEERAAQAALATLQAEQEARAALAQITRELTQDGITAEQRLLAQYRARLTAIEEARRAAGREADLTQELAQARLAADQWYAEQSKQLDTTREEEKRASLKRIAEQDRQLHDEALARQRSLEQAQAATGMQILQGVQSLAQAQAQAQGEGAIRAFRIAQASAIAQITINTIQAASKAIAELGPLGLPAAVALAAIGAGQAATVAAQQPPRWYRGLDLQYADSSRGQLGIVDKGEAQLNRSGVAAAGGSRGVRDLNRGRSRVQTVHASLWVDGQALGSGVARDTRRGGEVARQTADHYGHLGHYQPGRG